MEESGGNVMHCIYVVLWKGMVHCLRLYVLFIQYYGTVHACC